MRTSALKYWARMWISGNPPGRRTPQAERLVAYNLRETRAVETGQDRGHEKSQTALKPLAMPKRRPAQPPVPSSRTAKR